jgi:FAD/FMN-containing dehydrogenase
MPYTSAQRMLDPAGAFGRRVAVASDHLGELDDRAIDALVAAAERMTSPLSVVNVVALGGAVARVGMLDTAYGHRGAGFHYAAYALWEDRADDARHVAWARSVGEALAPYAAGAYVNELGDEGEERTRAAYDPAALHHLAAVKRAYDPDNLFRHNRNIAP